MELREGHVLVRNIWETSSPFFECLYLLCRWQFYTMFWSCLSLSHNFSEIPPASLLCWLKFMSAWHKSYVGRKNCNWENAPTRLACVKVMGSILSTEDWQWVVRLTVHGATLGLEVLRAVTKLVSKQWGASQ